MTAWIDAHHGVVVWAYAIFSGAIAFAVWYWIIPGWLRPIFQRAFERHEQKRND
jgi:hypothetical protein